MQTVEGNEMADAGVKTAALRVHPLIYGQTYRLPPIETAVVQNVTFHEKFGGNHFAKTAGVWLAKLIQLNYDNPNHDVAALLSGDYVPSLERLQGAPDMFCEMNGLSDDAFIVIAAVTLHRSDGVDGHALLKGASDTLNGMMA